MRLSLLCLITSAVFGIVAADETTQDMIQKLTGALNMLKQRQRPNANPDDTSLDSGLLQLKIVNQSPPQPKPRVIIQTMPAEQHPSVSQQEMTNLLQGLVGKIQKKLAAIKQESKALKKKSRRLEDQKRELALRIAAEKVRHRDTLKELAEAHVKIQAELVRAQEERKKLERERVDNQLQRP